MPTSKKLILWALYLQTIVSPFQFAHAITFIAWINLREIILKQRA